MLATLKVVKFLFIAMLVSCSSINAEQGQIIFLNGTTTAGKSSISKELARLLTQQSFDIVIFELDGFIIPVIQRTLIFKRLNPANRSIATLNLISPEEIERINLVGRKKLCLSVKEAYAQGKTVIIDDVMHREDQIDFYKKAFQGLNVNMVLVYCPILTLIDRITKRNNNSWYSDQRSFLEALDHFCHLYQKKENQLQALDTLSKETLESACSNALEQHNIMQSKAPDFIKGILHAVCPLPFAQIRQSMIEKFALDNEHETLIGPATDYNCIVNTGQNDSASCAKMIIRTLRGGSKL